MEPNTLPGQVNLGDGPGAHALDVRPFLGVHTPRYGGSITATRPPWFSMADLCRSTNSSETMLWLPWTVI